MPTWLTHWTDSGLFPAQQSPIYFDRADVKSAIHAPTDQAWALCSSDPVFATSSGRDTSTWSALSVLPSVLERNQRSVIMHGLADYILLADGNRIAIQKYVFLPLLHKKGANVETA